MCPYKGCFGLLLGIVVDLQAGRDKEHKPVSLCVCVCVCVCVCACVCVCTLLGAGVVRARPGVGGVFGVSCGGAVTRPVKLV